MFVTKYALYELLSMGLEDPSDHIPKSLSNKIITITCDFDISEVCNGVVNPITKETMKITRR